MNWTLARFEFTNDATVGALYDETDAFVCYTLEDAIRTTKVYGKTAIPKGIYRLDYTHSGRFGRQLPLLVEVPYFSGIRIHAGNTVEDTDGCLLVGTGKVHSNGKWSIYESRAALDKVCKRFDANTAPLMITVMGGYAANEMKA